MLNLIGLILLILLIAGVYLIFRFIGLIFQVAGFFLIVVIKIIASIFWIIIILSLATCIL